MKKHCRTHIVTFGIISLLVGLVACKVEKVAPKVPIPDQYQSYQFLSSNKARSQSHRIVKVIDYSSKSEVRSAFYDRVRKLFFVQVFRDKEKEVFLKINNKGEVLDTLYSIIQNESGSTKAYPLTVFNGVIFYDDFYVDWFHTGDKSLKNYQYKADMDTMSEKKFAIKYRESSLVYYEKWLFNKERVDAYLLNEQGWGRLSSNKLYKGHRFQTSGSNIDDQPSVSNLFFYEGERCDELTAKSFPKKNTINLIQLFAESYNFCIPDVHKSVSISEQYMHKVNYIPASGWGATAPRGKSWDGIVYNILSIDDDTIPFKTYDIGSRSTGFSLFSSINKDGQKKHIILDGSRSHGATRFHQVDENSQSEHGLYLVVPN